MRCVRSLGRIISRWRDQIVAWHQARVPSNGSTEAVNNLVKRVKRVAFGIINSGTTGWAGPTAPDHLHGT